MREIALEALAIVAAEELEQHDDLEDRAVPVLIMRVLAVRTVCCAPLR
jgi:hypothetical protein